MKLTRLSFVLLFALTLPIVESLADVSNSSDATKSAHQLAPFQTTLADAQKRKVIFIDVREGIEMKMENPFSKKDKVIKAQLSKLQKNSRREFDILLKKYRKDQTLVFACATGSRSLTARNYAASLGYKAEYVALGTAPVSY